MQNKIFLDTIAFTAFINRKHPKYYSTVEAMEEFARLRFYLFTSTLVIAQAHEHILNHVSPSLANSFIKILPLSSIKVLRPTPKDEKLAQQLITQPTAFRTTYQEALHVIICRRKQISRALSTSPHFPQYNISLIGA